MHVLNTAATQTKWKQVSTLLEGWYGRDPAEIFPKASSQVIHSQTFTSWQQTRDVFPGIVTNFVRTTQIPKLDP